MYNQQYPHTMLFVSYSVTFYTCNNTAVMNFLKENNSK